MEEPMELSMSSSTTERVTESRADKLYEINDDPKRKEFLDDLFSFMQKRGTPINRLPIMAKSVLDLYELYNLVIARGGLVDVINKKLWQEIIKGLHLPSSITSAAFTLRTQYMKYLYPYECDKRNLSSPDELQSAIDGNRREGRRSGYSQYEAMHRQQSQAVMNPMAQAQLNQIQQQMQLNRMTSAMAQGFYFPGMGIPNGVHPSHPPPMGQPVNGGPIPGLAATEMETRMIKYMEYLNKEIRNSAAASQVAAAQPIRNNISPPVVPTQAMHPFDVSRMALWNIYNNNQAPAEPQQEALNLANGAPAQRSPVPRSPVVKEEAVENHEEEEDDDDDEDDEEPAPSPKKIRRDSEPITNGLPSTSTNIKIDTRGDPHNGESSMVVSMEFNGIKYQGVLFAQNTRSDNRTSIPS